jgi:hypothetical protein
VAERLQNQEKSVSPGKPLFKVVVGAGKQDRQDAIVRVDLEADPDRQVVTLRDADGKTLLGQISEPSFRELDNSEKKQLTFVLPELAAGKSLELTAYDSGLNSNREFAWHDDRSTSAELWQGDIPVMKCMYEPLDDASAERRGQTCKVYHHLYSPTGCRLITKGPGGLFPHHRGLFFGFNKISYGDGQKADVWHCREGESQTHEDTVSQVCGPVFGRDLNRILWRGKDGAPFAEELREMTAYKINGATLIEFDSILKTLVGPIELKGDPQHAGFQFRASQEVPDEFKQKTFYIRPDGKAEPGEFRNWSAGETESAENRNHVNLPWNAINFVLKVERRKKGSWDEMEKVEQPFTVCYLDHPDNPKPARFSERDYGRFGSYFEYTLTPDNPLHVRYRIWVQEDEMSVSEIQTLSESFVDPVVGNVSD